MKLEGNNNIKKIHKKLIDNQGRRKYFSKLNPVLLEKPFNIDIKKIKNKQKILFIVPNFHWIDEDVNALWDLIPWNLCQIASVIEDVCAEIKIIDSYKYNLSKEELSKQIKDFKPDVVGLTILMDQYAAALPIVTKMVKDISKNIKTVLGGVYAMANPKRAMQDKNLDYVVIGEGEYTFKQLVGFFSGACDLPERGICFRKNTKGELENRGHSAFIKDLDALPKPAYHLIDYLAYGNNFDDRKSVDAPEAYPYVRIVTSRGCPEKCSFCQVPSLQGSFFRARSPDHICDEIEWMKKKYGVKSIVIDDDNWLTNKKRAKQLLKKMIERKISLPWTDSATAVFRLDHELIDLMVESGCRYLNVAIESGNKRVTRDIVLKPVDHEHDYDHAKKMVAYAKKKGIFVSGNFIIGFPTETWDEIRETISFAEEINVDYAKIFIAVPLRNTELYDLAKETGSIIMDSYEAKTMWTVGGVLTSKYWSSNDLTFLRAYEWDRVNFTNPEKLKKIAKRMGVSIEELNKIRRRTLRNSTQTILNRIPVKSDVKNAADIALVK